MKTILIFTVVLVAIALVFLLAPGSIERLIRSDVRDDSSMVPVVRHKISHTDSRPVSGGSGKNPEPTDALAGITRTFVKPSKSEPAEAVLLEISAVEQNNELIIAGKLFDGSACNRLQIDLELNVDDGRKIFHTLILGSTNQTGERSIRSKRRLPPPSSARSPVTWRAHVAALRCLDP